MQQTPAWTVVVLEKARLQPPQGEPLWLDKKTAALLAWLSWEGPSDRAVLGGTLWPDSGDGAARANLRQLLSRLHRQAGSPLVEARGPLRLRAEVTTDLQQLREQVSGGRISTPARPPILLPGVDLSENPELESWVASVSEQLRKMVLESYLQEVDRRILREEYAEAMSAAQGALIVDRLSERAHRRVIELHLLLGDRAAAMRAYKKCEELLREELDVRPMPETMAPLLKFDGLAQAPVLSESAEASLVWPIAYPSRFVGRLREIARIQEILRRRKIVFLHGPSGIGKSRLVREALRGWKLPYFIFEGRPADRLVPYSTHLRSIRQVLHRFPRMELEPWVRRGISRMFPDRKEEEVQAAPDHEFTSLFFGEANVEFMKALSRSGATIVVDDMQFHDSSTLRLETYMLSSRINADFQIGSIIPMRPDLPKELLDTMERVLEAGAGELIEVPPLSAEEQAAFIAELGLGAHPELEARLEGISGNPGAILQASLPLLKREPRATGSD